MTKIYLSLLLSLSFLSSALCQLTNQEIDKLTYEVIESFNLPGVSVGVVKDGKIVHSEGYGYKSIETKKPMDKYSLIDIASNTKAFTVAALAILIEQEKISWTDKVIDHIPEFRMYDPFVTAEFTIEDLLTHRSGLGIGAGDLTFIPDGTDFSIEDLLTMFQHFEPESSFRSEFAYDNILYIVAGELIQRVSQMSWDEFLRYHIFNPLGMKNSFGSLSSVKNKSSIATPHINSPDKIASTRIFEDIEDAHGAGGVFSSINDMCLWMMMHLNHGKYGDNLNENIFSVQSQEKMWSIHMPYSTEKDHRYDTHFSGYGLGWELRDMKEYKLVHHAGFITGMVSEIFLVPDLNLGICVFINSSTADGGSPATAIILSILDSYLGLKDNDWSAKFKSFLKSEIHYSDSVTNLVWQTVKKNKNSSPDPNNFIGLYEDAWFGKAEVFLKDNQLWFKSYRSPKLNGPMRFYKANTFAIKWEYQELNADAFASFNLNERGLAESIKLKGISPNIDFSFDFQHLNFKRIENTSNK